MQTILGAGGAIGIELAKELKNYTDKIRLVSRTPNKVNASDELYPVDLLNRQQVFDAVKGSDIVYLVAGLKYQYKVWKKEWPELLRNVLDACVEHKAKLVFFDNVYMIGGDNVKYITEESPISPTSKKGEIRALLDKMIMEYVTDGKLKAIIARSADFYGPINDRSLLIEMVVKNLLKGKKAQWLANCKVKHSFTYYKDAAKGTAILGNNEDAFNQIWNLPTSKNALTGEEWIKLIATEMGTQYEIQVVSKWLVGALGFFIPFMKELYEMIYQYDREYFFDSNKFEKRFNYQPLSNLEGIKETLSLYKF